MSDFINTEYNLETGEIIERKLTDEEKSKYQTANEKAIEQFEKQKVVEANRVAALAKLAALGLTLDDLAALGL